MKHTHYCTECLNPVTCPALQDGDCEDSFVEIVKDICQSCWENQDESHMESFEKNNL